MSVRGGGASRSVARTLLRTEFVLLQTTLALTGEAVDVPPEPFADAPGRRSQPHQP